jgi:flavin reductase (DIM6/NTAB) family NADH-FMN oxidoreductase RutF
VTADTFARIMVGLEVPMFLVTTVADGQPEGCLIGFGTQCSIDPPRFMVCLSDKNRTTRAAVRAEALAVHLIPRRAAQLAELFGGETGDELDKFERCRWHPGPAGLPILEDCDRWFAGWILDRGPCGDHIAFQLEVFAAFDGGDGPVVGFHEVQDLEPGHDP